MVAPTNAKFPTAGPLPNSTVRLMGIGPVRFTVADALGMVERGILPEDATVELLDGELVYRDRFDLRGNEIVEGFKHNFVITRLGESSGAIKGPGRHMRTQSVLICSETHAPIPDAVILRGVLESYNRLPTAADATCVIEVADSSYERDAGEKLKQYARAGVVQYVNMNLRNRTAEVYSNPDTAAGTYASSEIVAWDQQILLRVGDAEFFPILFNDLLP